MGKQHPFRFGLINETPSPPGGWDRQVIEAEDLGYHTFLIRDHLGSEFFGDQLGPIAALATAAALTSRLRVGTMVIDNDFRHPAILAKELATIDQLSAGRLEVGLGAGWLRAEYEQAGLDYDPAPRRVGRLAEAVAVLKQLFSGEPVHFSGEHYTLRGQAGFPYSRQRPHPPLMIGGGRPRILELAGREADIVSILSISVASGTIAEVPADRLPEAVEQKLEWVRRGAGERYPEVELSLVPVVVFGERRLEAARALIEDRGWTGVEPAQVLEMPSVLIGTVGQIMEQMVRRRERYGFSYYVFSDRRMREMHQLVTGLAA